MKFFDALFKPYAEYCLRTTFSEDELKKVFAREIPLHSGFAAGFRAMLLGKRITFFRTHKPLVLMPCRCGRNSLWCSIFIQCAQAEYSPETILHITIAPQNTKWFIRVLLCFYLLLGLLAWPAKVWQMFPVLLLMPVFSWMALASCRLATEGEIPQIQKELERALRNLEKKYRPAATAATE